VTGTGPLEYKMTITARPIMERIVCVDLQALTFNSKEFLASGRRLVDLECGHKAFTRALKRAKCHRCSEMLRRSIETGEEDHDAFRNRGAPDRMSWPGDPLRKMHEPTDLAGNLIYE
jgi:hypothetical protein